MGVGGQRHSLAALPPGKDPVRFVQETGWAPRQVWTGGKNSRPPGFDSRTVQPVASRYTDWAIPAHTNYRIFILDSTLHYTLHETCEAPTHCNIVWNACTDARLPTSQTVPVVRYFEIGESSTSEKGICDIWHKIKTTKNHFESSSVLW